jgi:hypothetical protein
VKKRDLFWDKLVCDILIICFPQFGQTYSSKGTMLGLKRKYTRSTKGPPMNTERDQIIAGRSLLGRRFRTSRKIKILIRKLRKK